MHQSTILRLTAIGSLAVSALADNAHLKVQFFSDADCKHMKPDNDRNPSDLNADKNECERPDHHLPGQGFAFRSFKYWFVGDDWEDDQVKYQPCNLHAYHEKACEDKKHKPLEPNWTLGPGGFYNSSDRASCHSLTSHDDNAAPFYALKVNCEKNQKIQQEDEEVTPAIVAVTSVVTTNTYITDARGSVETVPTDIVVVPSADETEVPGTVIIAPTLTEIIPWSKTTLKPEATITKSKGAHRPLHARDVTARATEAAQTAVVAEAEVATLIQKLGEDLDRWMADLDLTAEDIERDTVMTSCGDYPCGNSGYNVWPSYDNPCSAHKTGGCGSKST